MNDGLDKTIFQPKFDTWFCDILDIKISGGEILYAAQTVYGSFHSLTDEGAAPSVNEISILSR